MEGLILNTAEPWRTHTSVRHHPPLFVVDGVPVFEVWFWCAAFRRWFCMTRGYPTEAARAGVVVFDSLEQLRAILGASSRG